MASRKNKKADKRDGAKDAAPETEARAEPHEPELGEAAEKGVEDAQEVVEETVAEAAEETVAESSEVGAQEPATEPEDTPPAETPTDTPAEAPASEDAATPEPDLAEPDPSVQDRVEPDPAESRPAEQAPAAPAPQVVRRGGFFPMLFGGVIAAGIGAGALYYLGGLPQQGTDTSALESQLEAQAAEIAALRAELAQASEAQASQAETLAAIDLAPLDAALTEQAGTDGALQAAIDTLTTDLSDTNERLGALEVQPIPEAELPQEVREAFERQVSEAIGQVDDRFSALETANAAQIAEMGAGIDARLADLEALQAETSAREEEALLAANAATGRAAAARISGAMDSGEPFADQLAILRDMTDITPPEALTAVAADGVTPVAALQASFPALAREILASVPRTSGDDAGGGGGGIGAILRSQLGARSLAPREGNDPDAVLSRAEAAVRAGDLDTALTELQALPEGGQALAADWSAAATALHDAREAADAIVAQLNSE